MTDFTRRGFGAFAAAGIALAAMPGAALAGGFKMTDYTPGLIQNALDRGETVFVDYATDWCTTCAAQERAISALLDENPAYKDGITFVRVDWDQYSGHEVSTSRAIPRRSTLLVLRGDDELGRIVAGTSKAKIKDLMDLALAPSS